MYSSACSLVRPTAGSAVYLVVGCLLLRISVIVFFMKTSSLVVKYSCSSDKNQNRKTELQQKISTVSKYNTIRRKSDKKTVNIFQKIFEIFSEDFRLLYLFNFMNLRLRDHGIICMVNDKAGF